MGNVAQQYSDSGSAIRNGLHGAVLRVITAQEVKLDGIGPIGTSLNLAYDMVTSRNDQAATRKFDEALCGHSGVEQLAIAWIAVSGAASAIVAMRTAQSSLTGVNVPPFPDGDSAFARQQYLSMAGEVAGIARRFREGEPGGQLLQRLLDRADTVAAPLVCAAVSWRVASDTLRQWADDWQVDIATVVALKRLRH